MSTALSGRRAAREIALLVLFAIDAGKLEAADEPLAAFKANLKDDGEVIHDLFGEPEAAVDPKLRARIQGLLAADGNHWQFVERLVRGVMDNRVAIDDLVGRSSLNWKVSRMSRVDRNILRLAAFELAFEGDVPGKATLNEAIEIAKRYGTEDSGKFVNGILDRIAQDLEQV